MNNPLLLSNRYELGETLGYGGMSEVHHGHDVKLGREVAVKILRADLATDQVFQERFRREAQNSAALNHPAIVAVFDTGEADTGNGRLPYIVMEYIEGRTLRDIVKSEGPMDQRRAMEVMADVCAALDFSHRNGIIHRDVKPANVMINKTGAVKVMDFGIARAIHDGQSAMTQTAAVIGTAQYLSPEQARGETVDARSDVYAAGCVLYEMLTGEPPFSGDSPVAVAYQHVREDPVAPSTLNPAVSPELDAVVLKALTKGQDNRYQSAAEMRADLVRVLSNQRPSAPMVMTDDDRTQVMGQTGNGHPGDDELDEEEARRRRKWALAVVAALAVAVLIGLLWVLNPFGSDTAHLRNVLGQDIDQAQNMLATDGFTSIHKNPVECRPMERGGEPPCDPASHIGKVFQMDPESGQQIALGQEITLSYGVPAVEHEMPNLADKTPEDAERLLGELNLFLDPEVEEVENKDPDKAGLVAEQKPKKGKTVTEGSTVTLKVYEEPEMVEVTDYTGEQFRTAEAGLEGAEFEVERKDVDSAEPEGTVVRTDPPGGEEAVKGSTVVVEVSNGSQTPMDMPDVIDMTQSQAENKLDDEGHKGEVRIETNEVKDEDRDGLVSKSEPGAGKEMTRSSTVTLTVDKYVKGNDNGDDDGGDDGNGGGGSPGPPPIIPPRPD